MQIWNSFFPDQLFEKPAVPVALDKPELEVEGHTLHVRKLGQSDVADSTAVARPGPPVRGGIFRDLLIARLRSETPGRLRR